MSDNKFLIRKESTTPQENTNNKISREEYFNFISHHIDDYSKISFTETEKTDVTKHLQKLASGSAAMVPMYCTGPMCSFKDRCVLFKMNKAPVGKMCLLEVSLLNHWVMQYMNEYDVDPENFTEVSFCNELAEIEVMLQRINMALARPENAELVIDQTVNIGQDGTPIVQKVVSPYMEQREKLLNRKTKVIKLMVGDRQEQYKKEAALKQKNHNDPSSKQAETRRKIDELLRSVDKISTKGPINQSPNSSNENVLTPDTIFSNDEE